MVHIIGSSGFIGSNAQAFFPVAIPISRESLYGNEEIDVNHLVIAAPSAVKWKINQSPEFDRQQVQRIVDSVTKNIRAERVTLFSTVDVFQDLENSNESSQLRDDLSYGGNRAVLELSLRSLFGGRLTIVRLPGIFGKGLKKNLIYDIRHDRIEEINKYFSDDEYQYANLQDCLQIAFGPGEHLGKCVNIVSEPLPAKVIANLKGYNLPSRLTRRLYNVKSIYSTTGYHFTSSEALIQIKNFLEN
jgi:hypothetical protein